MKRKNVSVEEEFFAYGDDEINGVYGRNGKGGQQPKASSPLSKVIQVLLVLVLLAILVVLGIIGYMYAKKALLSEERKAAPVAVQKKTSNPPAVQQSVQHSVTVQQVKPAQKQPQPKVEQKTQSSAVSSVAQVAQAQVQPATQPVQQAVASAPAKPIQAAASQVSSSSAIQSSSAPTATAKAKSVSEMSDEELIAYLRSLKPDQLKKLNIEELILARKKKEQGKKQQNIAVAKTEYLNNQVVLDKNVQTQKEKSQIAALSQQLAAIVQTTPQKIKNKQYIKGLEKEAKVREEINRYYIVKRGDSLSKIAKQFYGKASAYVKIFEANQDIIQDPRLIFPGQKLRIPNVNE